MPEDEMEEPLVGKLIAENRPRYERIVFVLWMTSAILVMGGLAIMTFDISDTSRYGIWAAAAGIVTLAAGVEIANPLQTLRTIGARESGGARYDRLRNWNRVKAGSILLNLLTIIGAVLLAGALLKRAGLLHIDFDYTTALRLTGVLGLAIGGSGIYAFWKALHTPIRRRQPGPETAIYRILLIGAVAFALLASLLASVRIQNVFVVSRFREVDVPFIMLAALTAASVAIFVSRSLPTIYALFTEEKEFYRGRTYMSQKKSVVMPTAIAFALLFGVLLVLILFQLGVAGLVEEIPRNYVLLSVFGFIIVSLAVAVTVSVMLSRSEDQLDLYKTKRTAEAKREITILGVSLAAATVLLILAAVVATGVLLERVPLARARWLDFFVFAVLASIGPFGFYYARKQKRVRSLEERFPDFLRDLAASRRAGLTLHSAVQIASKGEYGALTPEIQKMADQLSWNVPFEEALRRFGERVKTPLIQRASSLIIEAAHSGGNVTDVLLAAATDAREIKNLENERRTSMSLYSVITYITFFVFLVVVAILYGTFIPQIIASQQAAIQGGATQLGGLSLSADLTLGDYRTFFFMAAIMQGLGNGVVAGIMESGRALSGLRHAFIMTVVSYITFTFILP